jgi:uroporphyrinogen-III decarboxylase
MPFGTPDEVRAAVREVAAAAKPDGGYIFGTAHNIQADTRIENVLALLNAYHTYGRY